MQQEGHAHATLALFARVVEGDGALPFAVLAPVFKLKKSGYYDKSDIVFALLKAYIFSCDAKHEPYYMQKKLSHMHDKYFKSVKLFKSEIIDSFCDPQEALMSPR